MSRDISDLIFPHNVGEHEMHFTRYNVSRWQPPAYIQHYNTFGDGGNWSHSYEWRILDDGENDAGQESVRIIYPRGFYGNFAKNDSNSLHMTFLADTRERVKQESTNYYLIFPGGSQYHFTKWTNETTKIFRMEGEIDPYSNRYDYVYSNGLITHVFGPNTNQFVEIEYSSLTNSQPAGDVSFTYVDGVATQVLLAGGFNSWTGQVMTVSGGSNWSATVSLAEGFHQYKFVAQYSTGTVWKLDPDNELWCYDDTTNFNQNSVAVIEPYRIVTGVRQNGNTNREVSYHYGWVEGLGMVHVMLTNVVYGDGSMADYSYYHPSNDVWRRPLLRFASDVLYDGPGRDIAYSYQTNVFEGCSPYSGQIEKEDVGPACGMMAGAGAGGGGQTGEGSGCSTGSKLTIPSSSYWRTVVDSRGVTNRYRFTEQTGQVAAHIDGVGNVYSNEYFMDCGMLSKSWDAKGRLTEYTRTEHFGAILEQYNSVIGTRYYAYSDTNLPFYVVAVTDELSRVTIHTRDDNHRITRTDHPDDTYETFAYNEHGQVLTNRLRDGSVWTYTYDDKGRRLTETDPENHVTHFFYDEADRLSAISNALGHVTSYAYKWHGALTNIVYPDGTQENFYRDEYGKVTSQVTRASTTNNYAYDDHGFMIMSRNPAGASTWFTNNIEGHVLTITLPSGLMISNTYDGIGRKTKETYSSDETFKEWFYDPDGVVTQIDRLGNKTIYTYAGLGWVSSIKDPNNNTTHYGYDQIGRMSSQTNALGDVTSYTYDLDDRITSIIPCSGGTVSNEYDAVGRLTSRIEASGVTISYSYNKVSRLTGVMKSGLLLQTNQFNEAGWLTWRQDANGLVMTNTYDNAGRLLRTYLSDDTYWENTYSNTYLYQRKDRAGRKTTYYRDLLGQVTNLLDNATNSVLYAYDLDGELTNLTDQAGNDTAFAYDQEGRLVIKTYDDGSTLTYAYNAEGRLLSKTNAADIATHYLYDSVGNLTDIDYATDTDVSFDYDALNRLTEMTDAIGQTDYTYAESCSRVSSVDGPFAGDTINYYYDSGKRLTNIVMGSYNVKYVLDGLDRITSVTGDEGTHSYTYSGNGRLIDELTLANGTENDYKYDSLKRLSKIEHLTSASEVLGSYTYTYNDADQRTKMTREDDRYIDYTYDPVGQLLDATGSSSWPGYTFNYQYDKAGNPVHQDRNGFVLTNSFNNLNQNTTSLWSGTVAVLGSANIPNGTVTVNGTDASEFANGTFAATNVSISSGSNKISAVITDPFGRKDTNSVSVYAENSGYWYDDNGNLTNDGRRVYTYNDADRLIKVRDSDSGDLLMESKYDALGRRRERVLYSDGVGATNRYVYDNWLVIAVLDHTNGVIETYTHGPDLSGTLGGAGGIGGILSVTRHPTLDTYTYHCDALGNVTSVTDTNEVEAATYTYSPFGQMLTKTGSFESRYTFSTKEWDSTVGLHYYNFRFFSPSRARWLNRDPMQENGGINLYGGVMQNPLRYVDIDGRVVRDTSGAGKSAGNLWDPTPDPKEDWADTRKPGDPLFPPKPPPMDPRPAYWPPGSPLSCLARCLADENLRPAGLIKNICFILAGPVGSLLGNVDLADSFSSCMDKCRDDNYRNYRPPTGPWF